MKQFNLEEYLKDTTQKVVTRDGRSARIVCMDAHNNDYPIIALIMNGGCEYSNSFTRDGEYYKHRKNNDDLFFANKETYRPYVNAEECFANVRKHGGWMKDRAVDGKIGRVLITRVNPDNVLSGETLFKFDEIVKDYVWVDDNTPCGVKEE